MSGYYSTGSVNSEMIPATNIMIETETAIAEMCIRDRCVEDACRSAHEGDGDEHRHEHERAGNHRHRDVAHGVARGKIRCV